MKNKRQILDALSTELHMKSKTISHIILEGVDGVGKTTMLSNLLKVYDYGYVVYDRGELSNFVYAKKYGRTFTSLQRNLPFIYVLLTASEKELRKRIKTRAKAEHRNDVDAELKKIADQKLFIEAAKQFKNDFHIVTIDTTGMNEIEACMKVKSEVDAYVKSMPEDAEETEWNKAYRRACERLGYDFKVRNNQPYIDDEMFMSESTWQNGKYETFTDKSCPDNLIFAMSYSESAYCKNDEEKSIDFAYVINSKINRRPKVIDYYLSMIENGKTCLVSEKVKAAIDSDNMLSMPRVFGNDFIKELSKAKATVYCAPDLEYLKLQTCRLYEGIMSRQIVFVDQASDKDCDILHQIFDDEEDIIKLLYVQPSTICKNYNRIVNDKELYEHILDKQSEWFENLKKECF